MKKIWILCFLGLAACDATSRDVADATEVRLIREPQTGACFVVVAWGSDGGSHGALAIAPSPCPARAASPAEVLPSAADGGLR